VTIAFTPLFTELGTLARVAGDIEMFQNGTLTTDLNNVAGQWSSLQAYAEPFWPNRTSFQAALSAGNTLLQQVAATILTYTVNADQPLVAQGDVPGALSELIRQMNLNAQTVKRSTITASSSAYANNVGNGIVVTSVKQPSGLLNELIVPETARLICTADGQPGGGATAGNETFQFQGAVAAPGIFDPTYPQGSGATATLTVINAANNNDGLTVLQNGNFETWTVANIPDKWTITGGGVAGTNILENTNATYVYLGSASLQIKGDSSTLAGVKQLFNSASTGTAFNPTPNSQLAFNAFVTVDVTPATGVLEVALIDGNNNVINDQQGIANSFTQSLTGLTSGVFVAINGVFRLPNDLPTSISLRIRQSTAISSGKSAFVDFAAWGPMTELYGNGMGPSIAIFAAKVNFITGSYSATTADGFSVVTTNSYCGAVNHLLSFQSAFDALYNTSGLGLLLPSTTGSPTLTNTLI